MSGFLFSRFLIAVHLYFKWRRIGLLHFVMTIYVNVGIGSSCNEEVEQRWITVWLHYFDPTHNRYNPLNAEITTSAEQRASERVQLVFRYFILKQKTEERENFKGGNINIGHERCHK